MELSYKGQLLWLLSPLQGKGVKPGQNQKKPLLQLGAFFTYINTNHVVLWYCFTAILRDQKPFSFLKTLLAYPPGKHHIALGLPVPSLQFGNVVLHSFPPL